MTASKGLGTYGNAVGVVTPLDHKIAQLGFATHSGGGTTNSGSKIRAGLHYGGKSQIVFGTGGMAYAVVTFSAVTTRGESDGAVYGGNAGEVTVSTTAAPGSNSRIDVVYFWHREYSLDGVDSNPVIGVVQGTAAASPTVPSLASFPGAIELARITVPAGVTATNSGTTITQTAPFTASAGGIVPVRSSTERDAGTWAEGQVVWRIDTDVLEVYNGSTWGTISTATSSDTGAVVPSLSNSWVAYGGAFASPSYRNKNGTVELFGAMKNGSPSATIFTLPVGSRPLATRQFATASPNAVAYVNVAANGQVQVVAYGTGGSNAAVLLDGISFLAQQ